MSKLSQAQTRESLVAALSYASRGWAVLPIRAGGKIPLTQHGVKDASTSELVIRGWWRTWPTANVGIATGSVSGIVVLDVDPRAGGDASLAALTVPETRSARTGGGGRHFLFSAAPGPRRGRIGWRPGLDIKGDGGYIVAPPSTHASGGVYEWDTDCDLAPEPEWLTEACNPPPPALTIVPTGVRSDAQVRRVRSYVARMPPSIEGQNGSGALMRVCGRLAAEVIDGKIDRADAWGLLCEYNTRAVGPWPEDELTRALDRALADPRQVPLEDRERNPMPMPQSHPANDSDWFDSLLRKPGSDTLIRCTENAIVILRNDTRWVGRLRLDTFASDIRVIDPPWHIGDQEFWSENDDTFLQSWLLREYGLHLPVTDCFRAVSAVAAQAPMHPVRDWMDSLRWDGTARLSTWLTRYLGAEDSPYTQSVGRWWLISAVARTYEPGCKADHLLILYGAQGIGKSSALRALTGSRWFSDTPLDLSNKDANLGIRGRLIIEMSELESFRRAGSAERIKAFFSSPSDHVRAPYMRKHVDIPRGCVFAGTTNTRQWSGDETGGRRFWQVECDMTDVLGLTRDRDQLWAEAVVAYGKGEKWWPETSETQAMVAEVQKEIRVVDSWESVISSWLDGRNETTTTEILSQALHLEVGRHGRAEQTRVGRVISVLSGWERVRAREGGELVWKYRRKGRMFL